MHARFGVLHRVELSCGAHDQQLLRGVRRNLHRRRGLLRLDDMFGGTVCVSKRLANVYRG